MAFIQLTSPLILAGDPTLPNHPATKQYVDAKANNINAAGFSAGVLNVMRLPAFTGDVTMEAGSGNLVLSPTGVTPGTYPKVTMDSRGRALSGGALTANDMPYISWSKITTGRPTTLAGYGLSSVIGLGGGTITGQLATTATPSAALHLVPKSYVDAMIQPSGNSLTTGDVVRKGYTATPSGFLRANGSKVSKSIYSALYSIIGDRYEVILNKGADMPFIHQEPLGLAGYPNGDVVKENGPTNSYSSYAEHIASFVTHNKLYIISASNNGGYIQPEVFYANLNADGSISTPWTYVPGTSFGGVSHLLGSPISIFFTTNKVWYMWYSIYGGGAKLYYSNVDSNGVISSQIAIAAPAGIKQKTVPVVVKNRLYLIDYDFVGSSGPLEIAYCDIDSNGFISGITGLGQISATATKNNCLDAFVYKNKLFAVLWTTDNIHQVFYASINSDGTLGPWTAGPSVSGIDQNTTARAVTTTTGIYFIFTSGYTWFTSGTGESAYSYQANGVKKLTLNTDAAGVPISWNLTGHIGETGMSNIGRRPVIVKNRLYLTFSHNSWIIAHTFIPFVGGSNTYKVYYDGTYTLPDPANFYLPDFTSKETYNTRYFIKT